jgi:(p)ppGpp synthase/HD superfamily hydrolase
MRSQAVRRAAAFCVAAHCAVGQKRKYTGEDYWHHPVEVLAILTEAVPDATEAMRVAALLHDVVEDTKVELATIRELFGQTVARYVEQLTDVSRPEDGNRATRKAIDRAHTALACPEAQSIKLADLISNSRSILERDPIFAVTYLAEKRALLEVLCDGDPKLYQMAAELAGSA